jgi:hypothetical protein
MSLVGPHSGLADESDESESYYLLSDAAFECNFLTNQVNVNRAPSLVPLDF